MIRFKTWLIPAVLAGSLVGGMAIAQGVMQHHMPSPEAMQRLEDGQIAGAIAALKMTDDQLKLWAPVEKLIRDQQAEHMKMMQAHMDAMTDGAAKPNALALPDRLDKMAEMMGLHAEHMKTFAAAFKPFYASLTDPQKEVVGPLLAHLRGPGHGGGGMGFGRGHFGHHAGMAPDAKQ